MKDENIDALEGVEENEEISVGRSESFASVIDAHCLPLLVFHVHEGKQPVEHEYYQEDEGTSQIKSVQR